MLIVIERLPDDGDLDIPVYVLSKLGKELISLIEIDSPFKYMEDFAKFAMRGINIAKYAEIKEILIDQVELKDDLKEFDFYSN